MRLANVRALRSIPIGGQEISCRMQRNLRGLCVVMRDAALAVCCLLCVLLAGAKLQPRYLRAAGI